jgi:hypothetical protein
MLIVDTAARTGSTLRKAYKKMGAEEVVAIYEEPPRIHFWYEHA